MNFNNNNAAIEGWGNPFAGTTRNGETDLDARLTHKLFQRLPKYRHRKKNCCCKLGKLF